MSGKYDMGAPHDSPNRTTMETPNTFDIKNIQSVSVCWKRYRSCILGYKRSHTCWIHASGTTLNTNPYCSMLQTLCDVIHWKRLGLLWEVRSIHTTTQPNRAHIKHKAVVVISLGTYRPSNLQSWPFPAMPFFWATEATHRRLLNPQ